MERTSSRTQAPRVVVVGGLLASGKSTVARRIAEHTGAGLLSADVIRNELFRSGERDALVPGFSATVYAELLARAGKVLDAGRPVVLDGTFRSRELRSAARRLAHERGVPFLFVECRAGVETCRARLRARPEAGWVDMLDAFLALWEPVDELPADEHQVVDTAGPVDDVRVPVLW